MSDPWAGTSAAYKSICKGFSEHKDFPGIYIKHFNSIDLAYSGEHYEQMLDHYIKLGAKTQEDIIGEKRKNESWTVDEDNQIKSLENNIFLMREKRCKASIESQLEEIDLIINEYLDKLNVLLNKKHAFFLTSAEYLADMASTDFVLSMSLFRDKELSQPAFSLEEVEHFTDKDTQKYVKLYHDTISCLDFKTIRKVSINPRFFDFFKNAVSAETFFGKNGKDLTRNQILLFDCAKYFHPLVAEVPDLTEEERCDPEKIEKAVILSRNQASEPEDNSVRNAYNKAKTFGR